MSFFLYYILPFVLVLGVLIFFHELGHFLIAKYFGVKVLKFSLGFGPKLVGKKIGETEYLISLVPLGGYVKMLGETDDEDAKPISPQEQEKSFSNKHVLKRIAIVGAGPFFNLFLALVIFCTFFMLAGYQVMIPEIGQVRENSPAHKAGLLKGDVIVSLAGKNIQTWLDIKAVVQHSAEKPIEIKVQRQGRFITFTVIPEASVDKNIFGEKIKSALIGIVASGKFENITLGPLDSIKKGLDRTWEIIVLTCKVVVKLFQGVVSIKTVGGPLMIGQMTGQVAQENWTYLFPLMAVISINLGILNLLPIPILDGGFIIFLLIELIIGKPLSIKKRELAQRVGLFLLITLMVVVMYNDIARFLE
jgi:regulator of sigma E protease